MNIQPLISCRKEIRDKLLIGIAYDLVQPVIIGTNVDDGVPFAPYDPNGVNKTLAHNQMLEYFFCPAWKSST